MELTKVSHPADDVALSLSQFAAAWRVLCAESPAAALSASDGIEYVFSGLPIGFFNIALPTGHGLSAEALTTLGKDACSWASHRDVPWMFIATHERLADGVDATTALASCGLVPILPLTGMRAGQISPASATPDGLHLSVPQDDAGCAVTVDINAAAYEMDLEASKSVLGRSAFWKDHVVVVGTADGTPACCAAVLLVDGYRYVALVATEPTRQRRGFGDAAMRHALDVSARANGECPTVLHATDAGRPVYERMGYETISTHTIFMEQRFLEGH